MAYLQEALERPSLAGPELPAFMKDPHGGLGVLMSRALLLGVCLKDHGCWEIPMYSVLYAVYHIYSNSISYSTYHTMTPDFGKPPRPSSNLCQG